MEYPTYDAYYEPGYAGGVRQMLDYNGPSAPGPAGGATPPMGAGDPFAYSGGSLLTPWTTPLPQLPGAQAGSGSVQMAPFSYGNLNYSAPNVRGVASPTNFSAPSPFSYDAYSAPQSQGSFNYNGPQVPQAMGQYPGMQMPDRFQGPGNFVPPTLTDDPGYQFRLQQGQQAITNAASAQGARGGDVLRAINDYNSGAASQEYNNAWNRSYSAFNQDYANKLSAYQADTGAQLQGQNQAYNQAANTYGLNLQAQGQGFGQALAGSQLNSQIASQNEAQRLAAYQTNYGVASGNNDRNFNQAFQTYNANTQNQLAAAGLNQQADIANGNLGWQVASGSYDRNYANALNSYQMTYQQANSAAGAGAAANSADYNRQMQQYQLGYDIYNNNQTNQFNRLYAMAELGQGSANAMTGAAGQNAAAMGNYFTGYGNSQAANAAANGAAWSGAAGGIGDTLTQAALLGSRLNPYTPIS